MHDTTTSSGSHPTQFLSFTLGGLEYGIDFAKVQELRVLKALERFASSGEIIGGVAVSRGVIMPLVDMRVACGTSPDAPDPMTDVIILKLSSCAMGMVVDGVTGVVTLRQDQVAPLPPSGGDEARPDYLLGLGQAGGRRLILVDIEKLMSVQRPASSRQVA
ncbi:chemotaxis protein CheW [Massilia norwichensis]|uniref:Chemotaxis protein CheW n=1 Tax=Massilia norwichensis TaxID=1442366 RepID=A0ABT2ABU9_9BURK|nr:chemotaxis protein CheW [Massilia norwichensis]MCS0591693.1 chemotaxis protein CheW [Massilia norwichensis]